MKAALTATIYLLMVSIISAGAYQSSRDSFDRDDWLSLYFGASYWSGDVGGSQHIVIQRLPDDRFLLSVSGKGEKLAVAKRYITLKEVNEIKGRVIEFFETAIEERKLYQEQKKNENLPTQSRHTTVVMKISLPGGNKTPFDLFTERDSSEIFDFGKAVMVTARFDSNKSTHEAYSKYLFDLIQRVEPGEVVNASDAAGKAESHLHD